MAVAERASTVSRTERVGGGHIMPVAEMRATTVGGTERVGGRHKMRVAEMRATTVDRTERLQSGDGEGRYGPTDQRQRTLQKSRLYLVTVAVTIG